MDNDVKSLEWYADWLARNPNLVADLNDNNVWVRSNTNSSLMYKGWDVKTGKRVL